jgi:hypothetical protein
MESLPIINKGYDLYKAMNGICNQLPKRWRYGLAVSLENSLLDCLENLIMAKNAPKALKAGYLIKASSKLEVSRFKIRLLLESKLANETKLFQAQGQLDEVGRMLGGWLKATQST